MLSSTPSGDDLRRLESPIGAEVVIDGRRFTNFAGSSYLGLSRNPLVLEAGAEALRQLGAGYQLARTYGVVTAAHLDAEAEAATFLGTEAALYLPTGYVFGLTAIAVAREWAGRIFVDELAHSCLRDAIGASTLPSHAFHHLDPGDLAAKLREHLRSGERPLIVTDGMYSVHGDIAPLDELAPLAAVYGGRLLVDESHSFGVLGASGRGAVEHHALAASEVIIGGSLSKGFGTSGGIIPATASEVEVLRGTPPSRGASIGLPAAAAMCAASIRYFREHPELLERLRGNVSYLKHQLRGLGLNVGDSVAPVASFAIGTAKAMQGLQQRLMAEEIFVLHSHYIGASREGVIRCGIFADHSREHLDRLVSALRRLL